MVFDKVASSDQDDILDRKAIRNCNFTSDHYKYPTVHNKTTKNFNCTNRKDRMQT